MAEAAAARASRALALCAMVLVFIAPAAFRR